MNTNTIQYNLVLGFDDSKKYDEAFKVIHDIYMNTEHKFTKVYGIDKELSINIIHLAGLSEENEIASLIDTLTSSEKFDENDDIEKKQLECIKKRFGCVKVVLLSYQVLIEA